MLYEFTPERVCSKKFFIDVDDETRTIRDFQFQGGCPGNLNGISRLVRGMSIDEVIERFDNMPICPSSKVTSCPEQLRKALVALRANLDARAAQQRPRFGQDPFSAFFRK